MEQTDKIARRDDAPARPPKELIRIGRDRAIVRRTPAGMVTSLNARVQLSKERKELTEIQGSMSISAAGYQRLNGVASINILTPPTVIVDGQEQANPFIKRDENGTVEYVFVRKIGLGRSKIGNLVAQDSTLYFNLRSYLVAMLHKRQLLTSGVVKITAAPAWEAEKDKAGKWFLPTIPGLGLVVDITAKDFLDVHKSYAELVQFADRRAATICARNVLKAHPGLAVSIVEAKGGKADVDVMGWASSDEQFRAMEKAAEAIVKGEAPPDGVDVQSTGVIEADPIEDADGFGEAGEKGPGEVIDVEPVETSGSSSSNEEAKPEPDPRADLDPTTGDPPDLKGRDADVPSVDATAAKCGDCRDVRRVPYKTAAGFVPIPCPSCQDADAVAEAMTAADAKDPTSQAAAAGAYKIRQEIENSESRNATKKGGRT